jgi:hypothetical protein
MAAAVGHAPSTIHRIWKAFGLQPHRVEAFKLSTDPLFVEKVRDIVGLYMAPRCQAWPSRCPTSAGKSVGYPNSPRLIPMNLRFSL